jgi:hypothetical protein
MQPRVLLDGLAMPESPRWHDGRLWFSNWGTRQRPKEFVRIDGDGGALPSQVLRGPRSPLRGRSPPIGRDPQTTCSRRLASGQSAVRQMR